MNRSDFLINNFNNIQEILRYFEQKANILLVIYGFIATGYLSVVKELKFTKLSLMNTVTDIIISIIILLLSLSILIVLILQLYILVFDILKPRIAKNYKKNEISLFYFGHISGFKKEDFFSKIMSIKDENYFDKEITNQIYEISRIAKSKELHYNRLTKLLFPTVLMIVLLIILVYT